MSRLWMSLFLGLAYILPGTAALTYWIDPQCDAKLSPPGTPVDTNPFRKRSALLMGEVIAADYLKGVGSLTPSLNRISANTRIYCDNDARWVPKQDGLGWKDPQNHMSTPSLSCVHGVPGNPGFKVSAVSYRDTVDGHGDGTEPLRNTIILCDNLLNATPMGAGRWLWRDIPTEDDFGKDPASIEMLRFLIPNILLHELAHFPTWSALDLKGRDSYGWTNTLCLTTTEALQNAEIYHYIAMLATLADRGFALDRINPFTAERGGLVKYDNIANAKRWLSRMIRW